MVPADANFTEPASQHVYRNGGLYRRFKENLLMTIGAYILPNLPTPNGLNIRNLSSRELGIAPFLSALAKLA